MWEFCAQAYAYTDATPGRNSRSRARDRNSYYCPQYPNSRSNYRYAD